MKSMALVPSAEFASNANFPQHPVLDFVLNKTM